jgi:hypothetical protein
MWVRGLGTSFIALHPTSPRLVTASVYNPQLYCFIFPSAER